jgi:Na+/proline symporter
MLNIYAVNDKIGSPQKMFELLADAAPVSGNAGGSYLTMRSLSGFSFGIINVCGNFATVFADQSYHQRGIASTPEYATRGFILGGLAWFAVPMGIASSLGLAARALYGKDPAMAMLTAAEISAGLPAPAAAAALLGKSGAAAMLVLLYLAVTSATSAQLIAVSSILTFDVWKVYIQPNASKDQLFNLSHVFVGVWALCMGILGLIFYYAGISMGYLYLVLGIIVCPAVFPVFSCLTWSKANRHGALAGMVIGLPIGIMSWLVSAYKLEGSVTLDTTSSDNPLIVGNLIALVLPAIITIVWSYISPENYTFEGTRAINFNEHEIKVEKESHVSTPTGEEVDEKSSDMVKDSSSPSLEKGAEISDDEYKHVRAAGMNPEHLQKSFKTAFNVSIPLTFILIIFVPCMSIIAKTFSPAGLGAWIGIVIAWLFISSFIVVILPVFESRVALGLIFKGIAKDLTGKRGRQEAAGADQ